MMIVIVIVRVWWSSLPSNFEGQDDQKDTDTNTNTNATTAAFVEATMRVMGTPAAAVMGNSGVWSRRPCPYSGVMA